MAAPSYDSLVPSETLPSYSSSIDFRGRLLCKRELEKPDVQAFGRRWYCAETELRGTTLILDIALGIASAHKSSPGHVRSYTLQLADVGLATDYKQRSNAFRVRVEGEQLLFLAPKADTAVEWVERLLTAIAISEPIEQQRMPRYPGPPARGAKVLSGDMSNSFGKRLWTELSWPARQRQDFLLEEPIQSRKERWKEVLHGKERQPLRSDSSTSISSRELSVARSNLALSRSTSGSDRSSSVVSPTQCPCAACWRRGSDIEPVLEAAADEDVMAKSDALLLSQSAAKVSRRCTRVLMKWRVWAQPPQTERRNNLPGMSSTQ